LGLILAFLVFAGICGMLARQGSTKTLEDFKRVARASLIAVANAVGYAGDFKEW
jgi:hypothetical protein